MNDSHYQQLADSAVLEPRYQWSPAVGRFVACAVSLALVVGCGHDALAPALSADLVAFPVAPNRSITASTAIPMGTLGGTSASATAMNQAGAVVGQSQTSDGAYHAFIWTQTGGMRDLGTLGGSSVASAINDGGVVVGASQRTGEQAYRAFVWTEAGGMEDLGTLGGSGSEARDVNNAGVVVGWSQGVNGTRAFIRYPGGQMQDLGTLGGAFSRAESINDAGEVAGYSQTAAGQMHVFVWTLAGGMQDAGAVNRCCGVLSLNSQGALAGTLSLTPSSASRAFVRVPGGGIQELGTLGGSYSYAAAINDAGFVIGGATTAGNGEWRAFISTGSGMQDLGTLGGSDTWASAINSAGVVVGGSATIGFSNYHAFVWTPDAGIQDVFAVTGLPWIDLINDNLQVVGGNWGAGLHFATLQLNVMTFNGFIRPVDNPPVINVTKAGSAVPVKFELGGNHGLDIFAAGYPKSQTINCELGSLYDQIDESVSAGASSLSYDAQADRYTYVWKTEKAWTGCRQLTVRLRDGTERRANFRFTK